MKADGLAAGKGVVVAMTLEEAFEAVDSMLVDGVFGSAGRRVIIEEYLEGEEASFFALVDGENALPLESAQDHKQVGDGDTGPNTGGMGAYSPAPILTKELKSLVMKSIIIPTVKGMAAEGCKFVGVLYAGLMIEKTSGLPKLIEYNVRFGDPECQVYFLHLWHIFFPYYLIPLLRALSIKFNYSILVPSCNLFWHTCCIPSEEVCFSQLQIFFF